jgi:hypothetical protein
VILYSVCRMALFAAAVTVLWVIGARGLLLLALSLVVSMALSYVLLRGPREQVARSLHERSQRRLERRHERRPGVDEAAEDAAVDAAEREER